LGYPAGVARSPWPLRPITDPALVRPGHHQALDLMWVAAKRMRTTNSPHPFDRRALHQAELAHQPQDMFAIYQSGLTAQLRREPLPSICGSRCPKPDQRRARLDVARTGGLIIGEMGYTAGRAVTAHPGGLAPAIPP
jgi:hypothetical protein